MLRTQFAGLTQLDADESLQTDNASFLTRNPQVTDRLLEIGAVTHRHDGHGVIAPPASAAMASAINSGGVIGAGQTLYIGYTFRDMDQGETLISDVVTVTTEDPLDPPNEAPTGLADYTAGTLLADTYYYAISIVDAEGGETPMGPSVTVEREPGFASGQVLLSNLLAPVAASSGAAWRLWRAVGGGDWFYIGQGATDTFTDDGVLCPDPSLAPVAETLNFTNGTSSLDIIVPGPLPSGASGFALYVSPLADFTGPALRGVFGSASVDVPIRLTDLIAADIQPPDVPTTIPGASKIDPDTELIDWHWKRPVANPGDLPVDAEEGDARFSFDSGTLWVYYTGIWQAAAVASAVGSGWGGGGGGGGGGGSASWGDPVADETALYTLTPANGDVRLTLDTGRVWRYNDTSGLWVVISIANVSGDSGFYSGPALQDITINGRGGISTFIDPFAEGAQILIDSPKRALQTRTVTLASGATQDYTFAMGNGFLLYKVESNKPARIQVYATAADRTADAGRAIGVAPTGDHGVMLDQVLPSGMLAKRLTPAVHGFSTEDPLTGGVALRVTNLDTTGDVTFSITFVQTE